MLYRTRQRGRINLFIAAILVVLLSATPSYAAAGTDMPWESPIQRIIDSLTGPVAQSALVLAIALLGLALAFSEGPVLRRTLGVVLGCALAATAASFAASLFGISSGATF